MKQITTIQYILRQVAAQNGVSEQEVYSEIQHAIEEAFFSSRPKTQTLLRALSASGSIPTPEEVITFIQGQLL